jgi:ubiquinol-cytochrome c reductase cytochrome b/c1 subunit
MTKRTALSLAAALALAAAIAAPAFAQEHATPQPPRNKWSFSGPFGTFDRAQLQRGFKVYREVCSTCHSIEMLAFRNLAEPGGPGYSPAQAAAVAAEYKIPDIDDSGQPTERPGRPADTFPKPFPNDAAARATHGAVPPDMSVLAKARTYERGFPWFLLDIFTQYQEQGPDYIVALMKGYRDAPKDFQVPEASYYNEYFPGHVIKMRPPLSDGQVTYDDGSPQTVEQYAKDIAAFLVWVAEPHMEQRKRIGLQVMVFLIVLSGLLYFTKKKVWADVHAH